MQVRLRSIPIEDPGLPKKASIAMGKIHPNRETCNAYIVFKNVASVALALKKNGEVAKVDCFINAYIYTYMHRCFCDQSGLFHKCICTRVHAYTRTCIDGSVTKVDHLHICIIYASTYVYDICVCIYMYIYIYMHIHKRACIHSCCIHSGFEEERQGDVIASFTHAYIHCTCVHTYITHTNTHITHTYHTHTLHDTTHTHKHT